MFNVYDLRFSKFNNNGMVDKTMGIKDVLAKHPTFLEPVPYCVPTVERLGELAVTFRDSIQAAADGDRKKIAERVQARFDLEQALTIVAHYLVMVSIAKKDPSLLLNTGFTLKKQTVSKATATSGTDSLTLTLTVRQGPESGSVAGKVNRVSRAASFEFQGTEGDPAVESTWWTLGIFPHCSKLEGKNLQPGKKMAFRARCLTDKGPGPWAAIVTLIVT